MTVVPCELLDTVSVHLFLDFNLIFIRNLTVLESHVGDGDARLGWVNLGHNQDFDLVSCTWHEVVSIETTTTQQPNYFVLGEIRVNVHQYLYFE
jgi:hypothetical protein